jgi:putative transposase
MKNNLPTNQTNFLLYTGNDGKVNVEVFLKDEMVWLTQKAIGVLFGKSKATISEHLKKIYAEGELAMASTVRKFRTVEAEGSRKVERDLEFSDIHHRCAIRLKGYDYSQDGLYFVTICTQNRECIFGKIIDDCRGTNHCALNEYGRIAEKEWIKTPEIRSNIYLDVFVIMPNHIHGIIRINGGPVGADCNTPLPYTPLPTPQPPNMNQSSFKSPSNNIGAIIRGYKSSVTKQINILRNQPGVPVWQRNYYEHIIRDEKSYHQISEYIKTNPLKWQDDKYYA